jgi:hypothetical protein
MRYNAYSTVPRRHHQPRGFTTHAPDEFRTRRRRVLTAQQEEIDRQRQAARTMAVAAAWALAVILTLAVIFQAATGPDPRALDGMRLGESMSWQPAPFGRNADSRGL